MISSKTDPTLWMWGQACELAGQAARLQSQYFRPAESKDMPAAWEPPADVFEDERGIVVVVAMPGVTTERLQIVYEPGILIVRGSRPPPSSAEARLFANWKFHMARSSDAYFSHRNYWILTRRNCIMGV
jgi:HSP20 family molecular chaperone IbpA